MTQQEFEALYGKDVTPAYFESVNRVYMACDTLDKRDFVRDWKKHEGSEIIEDMKDSYYKAQACHDNYVSTFKAEMKAKNAEIADICYNADQNVCKLVDFLYDLRAGVCDLEAIDVMLSEVLGKKEYLRRKIGRYIQLTGTDKDALMAFLA